MTDDQRKLEKLAKKDYSSEFFRELRRLEGVDFDSPFNFAWRMDFADVFSPKKGQAVATMSCQFAFVNEVTPQQSFVDYKEEPGGFDIIVGNPPFVTARNPVKRKLWRERWKFVCTKNYQLVSPFFRFSRNFAEAACKCDLRKVYCDGSIGNTFELSR